MITAKIERELFSKTRLRAKKIDLVVTDWDRR